MHAFKVSTQLGASTLFATVLCERRCANLGPCGAFCASFLLIGNAVFFVWLGYIVATDPEPATDPQFVLACGVLILLALNFFYISLANQPLNWRIFRLIGLWFDAKVSELSQRADRSREEK